MLRDFMSFSRKMPSFRLFKTLSETRGPIVSIGSWRLAGLLADCSTTTSVNVEYFYKSKHANIHLLVACSVYPRARFEAMTQRADHALR